MKKPIFFSALALAGMASMSIAQVQNDTQARNALRQSDRNQVQEAQLEQQQEQGPMHTQKCIRDAASDNEFEIQAGKFVEQRAQDPQVKQLAQRLAQDHQQAQQQLQQVGQQLGVQVSQQLDPVKQAMLQELQQEQGKMLERHFVFGQVGDHEKDILIAQWAAQHEQSPQLKQYYQQQVPVLEEHLRQARQISDQWVPQARQAGERMPANRNDQQNPPGGAGINR